MKLTASFTLIKDIKPAYLEVKMYTKTAMKIEQARFDFFQYKRTLEIIVALGESKQIRHHCATWKGAKPQKDCEVFTIDLRSFLNTWIHDHAFLVFIWNVSPKLDIYFSILIKLLNTTSLLQHCRWHDHLDLFKGFVKASVNF